MKLKTKIWQQEYIDFGSLLVNLTLDCKFQLTLHNSNEGLSPSSALELLNKPKKISSIEIWLQAFHVFVGIYASRYPNEAPGLMKYGSTIQDLAAHGHNWRFYNENFRFLCQSQATPLSWGIVHWELWLRSQSNLKKPPTSFTGFKPLSPISISRGYCFKFHRGGDCTHTSTPVVNVKGPIRHSIVIFMAPEVTPESPLRSLLVCQPHPRPIQPHLPTPIKVNNLLFLSGYDNSIVEF